MALGIEHAHLFIGVHIPHNGIVLCMNLNLWTCCYFCGPDFCGQRLIHNSRLHEALRLILGYLDRANIQLLNDIIFIIYC
jgi:hypothetical protein